MPRVELRKGDAPTDYWYIQPKFKTQEDAKAAAELLQGLAENTILVHEKKVTAYGLTIAGRTILEVFKVPNRSYEMEDVKGLLEERHFAAKTADSYMPQLVREGYLKKLGPKTYFRPHDATPALPTDCDLEAASDGPAAGLEFSSPCGCGCGDEG